MSGSRSVIFGDMQYQISKPKKHRNGYCGQRMARPVRYLRVICLASMLVTNASLARAGATCERVETYRPVSNPLIVEQIEARLSAMPSFKNHQIREIDRNFAIAWQDEDECRKLFRCHYLLMDTRNSSVKDVLTFRGTGTVYWMYSPVAVWSIPLNDDYSMMFFETSEFNYLTVRLPRLRGGPVWVNAASPHATSTFPKMCAALKYK